jgi:hypothetical protein
MQMPEMLAQAIRERGVLTSTHLLLLISRGKRHETSVPKVAGTLNCLVKPVKQSDLNNALVNILGNVTLSPQSLAEQRIMSTALVKPQPKRLRVLVAEDNVVNQRIALKQLQKLGCNADGVASGIEAIAALDSLEKIGDQESESEFKNRLLQSIDTVRAALPEHDAAMTTYTYIDGRPHRTAFASGARGER